MSRNYLYSCTFLAAIVPDMGTIHNTNLDLFYLRKMKCMLRLPI